MANMIEELYFGNIDPQARCYKNGDRITKVSDDINQLEEKLTERLNAEEKRMFFDFCNKYAELMGTSGLDSFIVGFRLGAKQIYDTFCSDDAPFESYLGD